MSANDDLQGTSIGQYEVGERVGDGGMGVVYRALDTRLGRDVAVKFLAPHLTASPAAKERFLVEARAAAAIEHEHLCTVYEFGEDASHGSFLVMPLYRGQTLETILQDGALTPERAVRIGRQVAVGMAAAHEAGIIHRDIKPSNILIVRQDVAKILDFGVARLTAETSITADGSTLGTAAYMSPEQLTGEIVDQQSDVWSVGCVLYEMLTGTPPFRGEYPQAVHYAILNTDPDPIAVVGASGASPIDLRRYESLQRIVDRCMARARTERYSSMLEFISDLDVVDQTPGVASSSEVTTPRSRVSHPIWRAPLIFALVIGLLAAIFWGVGALSNSQPAATRASAAISGPKRVAILPFENLNSSADTEYFSDGIAEDILTQLGKVGELSVLARAAVRKYKGTTMAPSEIAEELAVDALLTGSVRRDGSTLRIGCQLINGIDNSQIWADTYDRQMSNLFEIQADVARSIAAALNATLTEQENDRIGNAPTANISAYDLYLQGRDHYNEYSADDNEAAIALFRNAIERDSTFGLAWAGLADALALRPFVSGADFAWIDSAGSIAQRAVDLAPQSAEAFKARALTLHARGHLSESLPYYERSLELNPNYYASVSNTAQIYLRLGRLDDALRMAKQGAAINPTAARQYCNVAAAYRLAGINQPANDWLSRGFRIDPKDQDCSLEAVMMHLGTGNYERAAAFIPSIDSPEDVGLADFAGWIAAFVGDYEMSERLSRANLDIRDSNLGPYTFTPINLGFVLFRTGRADEAMPLFRNSLQARLDAIAEGAERWDLFHEIAGIHAILGNREETFRFFQDAIDAGFREVAVARRDPWFADFADDPVFRDLLDQAERLANAEAGKIHDAR